MKEDERGEKEQGKQLKWEGGESGVWDVKCKGTGKQKSAAAGKQWGDVDMWLPASSLMELFYAKIS